MVCFAGRIVEKYELTNLDNSEKCTLEVLVEDNYLVSQNVGKIVTVLDSMLRVQHASGETLTYPINNANCNKFSVLFGLEEPNESTISSKHMFLIVNKTPSLDEIKQRCRQFGTVEQCGIKWSDIGDAAQGRLRSEM